jgi:hypothetical protein
MVDRVPSKEFSVFIRKIGYSVGLEHTLERLNDFARLYGCQDTLSYADISRLLHSPKPDGWGLDRNNEHILDVLRSLGVIDVRRGEVAVLEAGDALGMLMKLQGDCLAFRDSARFIFAYSLAMADGDIFFNALAACFDPEEFAKRLLRMIEFKWTLLEGHFSSSHQRAAIYSAINVETQENNPGSRGKGGLGDAPDPARLRQARGALAPQVSRPEPKISGPYLAKALPRRKSWAVSLGLASDSGVPTPVGERLLKTLAEAGYCGPSCIAMWPLGHELLSPAYMALREAEFPVLDSWSFMLLIGRGMGLLGAADTEGGDDEVSLLRQLVQTYRALNTSKSIVRTELPARVAYRCALSLSMGRDSVADYPALIDREQRSPSPRILARPSRLAESALSI